MKNLLKFKKELEKHQTTNIEMMKWCRDQNDEKMRQVWFHNMTNTNFILFMLDKFIQENETEKPKTKRRKKNESVSDVPMVSTE